MTLAFNQNIVVPSFKKKNRRQLLEMATFDLRKVVGLEFQSNSGSSAKDSQFSLLL
jgi:hypothetical protein